MAAPATPRFRLPYGAPDDALLRLDTIVFGGWSPWLDGIVAATRTFAYHGGFNADGSLTADGTIVIPDASTKYVQRTYAGVVTADAALDLVNKIPMAIVTAAGGLLTHFEDIREIGFWNARARLLALYGGADGSLVYSLGGLPTILAKGLSPNGYLLTLIGGLPAWAPPVSGESMSLFPKTVLQLHMNGANNSVVFTCQKGRVVTPTGNAKISTAQSKFGGASAVFDGLAGTGLTVTAHKAFQLSGLNLIELWINTTQLTQYATLIERDNGSFGVGSWSLLLNNVASSGKVTLYHANLGSPVFTSLTSVNDGAWHHIAVVGMVDSYYLFVDGVLERTFAFAAAWSSGSESSNPANILIGRSVYAARGYVGYIDELRIVNGAPGYTDDFVPPAAPYADS